MRMPTDAGFLRRGVRRGRASGADGAGGRRGPAAGAAGALRARDSGAAGRDDADHALEGIDGVATAALHLGVGIGERLDRTREAFIRPALQIATRAVDLPTLQPELAREIVRR